MQLALYLQGDLKPWVQALAMSPRYMPPWLHLLTLTLNQQPEPQVAQSVLFGQA